MMDTSSLATHGAIMIKPKDSIEKTEKTFKKIGIYACIKYSYNFLTKEERG